MSLDTKRRMLRKNGGKPKMSLVPRSLVAACARVLEYGTVKYERNDWRKAGPWTEIIDCLLRHVLAFNEGEDRDPESGLLHTDHMAANIAFLCDFIEKNSGTDDRWKDATKSLKKEVKAIARKNRKILPRVRRNSR